eukprot:GEMP01034819.1.p1 GENE.GEMP01034819.1~~GEMP01034819.1.p1  ORF type:complete len:330 (+),score=100.49 GEMP01034819.1:143-1132(+)
MAAYMEPLTELCCPITLQLFHDPVRASDGVVYEKTAILDVLTLAHKLGEEARSPLTRDVLEKFVVEDEEVRRKLVLFRERRRATLLDQKDVARATHSIFSGYELIAEDEREVEFLRTSRHGKTEWAPILLNHEESGCSALCPAVLTSMRSVGWDFADARKAFDSTKDGWSLHALKRVGVHSRASIIVLDIVCESRRSLIGAFTNGSWKASCTRMYGRDGFVFADHRIYCAKNTAAHMSTKANLIDFGCSALTITDGFVVNSEFSPVYDSPPLTPVRAEFAVERVRLFAWMDETERELSVMEDPRYAAERMLIQVGTHFGNVRVDRDYFN